MKIRSLHQRADMARGWCSVIVALFVAVCLICGETTAYYTRFHQSPEIVDTVSNLSFLVPPEDNSNTAALDNEISNTVISMILREMCKKLRNGGSASVQQYCSAY
ncbi:hypothetical protein BsWGS_06052 [Bradybaena similaris]